MDSALRSVVAALVDRGLDERVLSAAAETAEQGERSLRSVLVDDQIITDFEYASAVADAYGLEAIELTNFPVDTSAMSKLPLALARRHRMLPIGATDSIVTVALTDPGNVVALDDIRAATGLIV